MSFKTIPEIGLLWEETAISACVPSIKRLYFQNPQTDTEPAVIEMHIDCVNGLSKDIWIVPGELNYNGVRKQYPLVSCSGTKEKHLFNEYLGELLRSATLWSEEQSPRGIYFTRNGWNRLPDGNMVYIYGNMVVGGCGRPYYLTTGLPPLVCDGMPKALPELLHALEASSPVVSAMVAVVALFMLRSPILESGIPLQATAYLYGRQGVGKTTLAQRVAAFVHPVSTSRAINFTDAGSTLASLREAMVSLRDLPLIVDDLCLSAGKATERRRTELAAQLLRESANGAHITKMNSDHSRRSMDCAAGVILTAEFALENASDITRCLFLPIRKQPKIVEAITPELVRTAMIELALWFTKEHETALSKLKHNIAAGRNKDAEMPPRMRTGYDAMIWAFECLLHAGGMDNSPVRCKLEKAINCGISLQLELLKTVQQRQPVGNLAYILYTGFQENVFKLAKNLDKLKKNDGLLRERDLCLRANPLMRFVRAQPGYQTYHTNKIVHELYDMGALVVQEDSTYQVHLDKKSPRVYRIRLDVLEKCAKEYV